MTEIIKTDIPVDEMENKVFETSKGHIIKEKHAISMIAGEFIGEVLKKDWEKGFYIDKVTNLPSFYSIEEDFFAPLTPDVPGIFYFIRLEEKGKAKIVCQWEPAQEWLKETFEKIKKEKEKASS